jgi:hypothetical protein
MKYIEQWTSEAVHGHQRIEPINMGEMVMPSWTAIAQLLSENGHFHSLPFASSHHLNHIVPEPSFIIFCRAILPLTI